MDTSPELRCQDRHKQAGRDAEERAPYAERRHPRTRRKAGGRLLRLRRILILIILILVVTADGRCPGVLGSGVVACSDASPAALQVVRARASGPQSRGRPSLALTFQLLFALLCLRPLASTAHEEEVGLLFGPFPHFVVDLEVLRLPLQPDSAQRPQRESHERATTEAEPHVAALPVATRGAGVSAS